MHPDLQPADAGAALAENAGPPVWLSTLEFIDGSQVDVAPGGVVVLVGPNNVGKTRTLVSLKGRLYAQRQHGFDPLSRLEFDATDDDGAVREWLRQHVPQYVQNGTHFYSDAQGNNMQVAQADGQADQIRPGSTQLGAVGRLMTLHADAERRLGLVAAQQPVNLIENPPTHPIHALHENEPAMTAVSGAFAEAFGTGLIFDWSGGRWELRLGGPIEWSFSEATGFPSAETKQALRDLEPVHEQGHGMRSYAGLLAELAAARHAFVLIDEPEAFLHPPQARQLGRHIASVKLPGTQAVVATHSATLLRGMIEGSSGGGDVTVVRLDRREGDQLNARILDDDSIRELWDDPILRYSNVLEGIFHHTVILCESDPDCALYEAVLESHDLGDAGRDCMFVHGSGVDRIPTIAGALAALGVQTAAVVDADMLLLPEKLERIAAAMGRPVGEQLMRSLELVRDDLLKQLEQDPEMTVGALREELIDALPDDDDAAVSGTLARKVRESAESRVKSKPVKRSGIGVLTGDGYTRARETLAELHQHGLFVVPTGELESWFKGAGGHGTGYVANVFEHSLHEDAHEAREVIEFLEEVLADVPASAGIEPDRDDDTDMPVAPD